MEVGTVHVPLFTSELAWHGQCTHLAFHALSPGVGKCAAGTSEARLTCPGSEEPLAPSGLGATLGSCFCSLFWEGLSPAGIYSIRK